MNLDLDIYDNEGKVKHSLAYPISIGDMKIEASNNSAFKSRGIKNLNDNMSSRMSELRQKYIELIKDYEKNKMIYESEFKFEPIVGHSYYLYKKQDGKLFLSLISPNQWKGFDFIGEYSLDYNGKWNEKKKD